MICFVPANVAMMGDEYPGPSPFHSHFTAPVPVSMAVSAPAFCPPRNAITRLPSTIGEVAVPYRGGIFGAFLRQTSLPLLRSCVEKMPLMPSVKTRLPAIAGVDFGPGPCAAAAELTV